METKASTNDLIATNEAARILGVSTSTLKSWRERKLFGVPFFTADERHGDTWYYSRERIEQLKVVYRKGVLQDMYKLADRDSEYPHIGDYQVSEPSGGRSDTSSGSLQKSTLCPISENTPPLDFQKSDKCCVDLQKSTSEGGLSQKSPQDFTYCDFLAQENQKSMSAKHEDIPLNILDNDLIATNEVAQILGVSTSTLEHWRERKLFGVPFFTGDEQRGNMWYYRRERVEQLKGVYRKGVLQNMYKLADLNSDNPWTIDFQQSDTAIAEAKQAASDSDLFTAEAVSSYLGIPVLTLQNWNAKKRFQPFVIDHNGNFRYTREQVTKLEAFCRGGKKVEEISGGQSLSEFLRDPENSVITRFNVQVYPSKRIFFPNDRFAKVLFNLTEESFRDMVEGKRTHNLVEVRNHRRFGKIVSPYRLFADESAEFLISEPADQIDFAVLCVCISERKAGNFFTTPAIIYRGLTGKVGKGTSAMPSVEQLNAIMNSINKLMSLRIDITMKDYCENFGCNNGESFRLVSNLLPCEYSTKTTINGKSSTIIHFLDQSPIWKIAELKNNQYLSFPVEYLDVPNQHNTPLNVGIKHYVLRRVMESIAHSKQMTQTITFDDIFKKCRLKDVNREKKSMARKVICDLFFHLRNYGVVHSFKINKKYNFSHSILFNFNSK